MRDAVVNTLGAADVIVNNAVIQYSWTSVLEQSSRRLRESVPILRLTQRVYGASLRSLQ